MASGKQTERVTEIAAHLLPDDVERLQPGAEFTGEELMAMIARGTFISKTTRVEPARPSAKKKPRKP